MAKRRSPASFEEWLIAGGITALLVYFLKTPARAAISGLPDANRKLVAYTRSDGTRVVDNEMSKLDRIQLHDVIGLIVAARVTPVLQMPLYKEFKGTPICEFRSKNYRLLTAKLVNGDFLLVSFFKKQSNETPEKEIQKALSRIKDYESRFKNRIG